MAYVNGVSVAGDATSAANVASPSFTITAGNLLVVFVSWVDTGGTNNCTMTDSAGNTWHAGTKERNSGTTASQMFYAYNISGTSTVITAYLDTTTTFRSLLVEQYNNIAVGNPFDVEATPTTGTSTTPTTAAFTTATTNELVVMFVAGVPATAAGSGYSVRHAINYASSEDQYFATAQTGITAALTTATSNQWNAHAMAFKLATSESPVTISRTNASLLYSPYTWNDDGTSSNAISNGSYVKFNFTGTSLAMTIVALTSLTDYPAFRVYIDNLPAVDVIPTSGQTSLSLASALANTTHSAMIVLRAMPFTGRWDRTAALKIVNFVIDNGATVSAPSGALAARAKNMVFFGDSITEGERVLSTLTPPAGADATKTAVPIIAEALGAEFGQVGHGSQGFNQAGVGSVPAFNTAYAFCSSGVSRLVSGAFSPAPDYVFCMHGTNGGVQSDVATAISNLRTAAPSARIFMVVPPGGFRRTEITAAVSAAITAGDSNLFVIDCGSGSYQAGCDGTPPGTVSTGPANENTNDTVHPVARTNARIAGKIVQLVQHQLEPRHFTIVGS